MALEKLRFQLWPATTDKGGFQVQFNPSSYSIVKPVRWEEQSNSGTNREINAPPLSFGGGSARTLTLNLFFDVTEGPQADVRSETNRVARLTLIEPVLRKPPTIMISWGEAPEHSDFPFIGVITNLTQNFTLFSDRGAPLRANLTVVVLESIDAVRYLEENDPDFTTTHLMKLGDTLSSIAAKEYRDPAQWRRIASANGIDDPRRLIPGVRLSIPKLG